MREEIFRQIADDLLIIPSIIGKSINDVLLKNIFSAIKEDITPPLFAIMKILNDHGEARISEVADWLRIPRSQMTHLVDKLYNMKYVERETDAADRRGIKIRLTGTGKRAFLTWVKTVRSSAREILCFLTDEELQDLADSLIKLRDIIVKITQNHYEYDSEKT